MANTIDVDLIQDTLAKQAKTTLGNKLVTLKAFTRDFSADEYVLNKNHQIGVVTGGSTTVKNPTSFGGGDSTKGNVPVMIDHYSQPFHITSKELNQGAVSLEQLAVKNLEALADSLIDVAMAPITSANFTASPDIAQNAITQANLKTAWAAVAKAGARNCILDSVAYSQFLPSDRNSFTPGQGAYGFDGFHLNTRWAGAETGVYGFVGSPDAVCVAAGIPKVHDAIKKLMLASTLVTIDSLGLFVQLNIWGSLTSRQIEASYDVMFGAAFGLDANAGYVFQNTP